jgi:hypothetical protein
MFYGIKVRKVRNPLLIFSTLHQNPPKKKYVFSTSLPSAFGSFYVLFPVLFLSRSARTILSAGSYFVHCAQIEFGHALALPFLLLRPIESGTAPPSSLFPSVAFLPPLDSLYCADCQSAFPLPPFPPPFGGRGGVSMLSSISDSLVIL